MEQGMLFDKIKKIGIVPVVKLEDAQDAKPLAKALCDGGLPCAEVTFRTEQAADAIKNMKEAYPEMLVGAGTVLTTSQVDEAVNAGSEFIVSPGLNPEVVEYCIEKNIPILPGCANPSDVEQAIKYGLKVVKFFPAEAATGGVNLDNINEYLNFDKIIACGGTWMVKDNLIKEKKFDEIQNLTTQAVHKMLGFKLAHIGINCDNEEQAHKVAEAFDFMFGFAPKENPSSIFSDTYVETMKTPFLGTKGHIAIAVNSVERAKAYLEQKNIAFNEDSAVYRPDGKMQAVYMAQEVGGFAIHLVRNPALS